MPNKVGTASVDLTLNTQPATQAFNRWQQTIKRGAQGRDSLFGSISSDARDFDASLGKATNRVVSFGVAAAVFTGVAKATRAFAESIVEVDKNLAAINVNLNQSTQGLKQFGAQIFNVARATGTTFEAASEAAAELARQGLSAEDTIKRLKDALILSRIAGLDSAASVEALTAAINSFNKEALTSTEIVNKFAAVDTRFAVSSKDLAEAVSRVGSTAQDAGVPLNNLIGLVTSLQQTTARGGAVIGNGLRTIFTRIQAAPETVSALEGIGVAIKNTDGSLRDGVSILRDYATARQKVGEAERASLDNTVAGGRQINILKALLSDLTKEYSVYGNAVNVAANATDEAIRKNEQLNQTIASLLNSTGQSIKQLFSSIGDQKLGGLFQTILKNVESLRSYFSGDAGDKMGESLGNGIIHGISNVLSGPALVAIAVVLINAFKKVITTIAEEARTLLTINGAVQARANIQKQINQLLNQANEAERAQYAAASGVLAKKEQILAIQARINQEELAGSSLTQAFAIPGRLGVGTRIDSRIKRGNGYIGNFADPLGAAIGREKAAGVNPKDIYVDRDPRVANFANPMGLLVANKRDEPLGGYQGVNRVIAEGGNPKTAGMGAPNFALTSKDTLPLGQIAARPGGFERFINEDIKIHAIDFDVQQKKVRAQILKQIEGILDIDISKLAPAARRSYSKLVSEIITTRSGDIEMWRYQQIRNRNFNTASSSQAQYFGGKNQYGSPIGPNPFGIVNNQYSSRIGPIAPYSNTPNQYLSAIGPFPQTFPNKGNQYGSPIGPQRGTIIRSESSYVPYVSPVGGGFDRSREVMDRNMARARQGSGGANQPLGPAYPINPALQARLAARAQAFAFAREGIEPGTDYSSPIGPPTRGAILGRAINRGALNRRKAMAITEQNRQRNQNRALGAAFILPFASGFIEPAAQGLGINTAGGTTGGRVTGALSGAAQGAGFGGVFGPQGLAIGAAVGALVGAFGKLQKSTEEYAAETEQAIAKRSAETDAIAKYLSIQSELNDAIKNGASKDVLIRLRSDLSQARGGITSQGAANAISESDPARRAKLLAANDRDITQQNARDTLTLGIRGGRLPGVKDFQSSLTPEFTSSLSLAQKQALGRAAGGKFDVTPTFNAKTGEGNLIEAGKAQEDFKRSLEEVTPILKDFVDVSTITPQNLSKIADTFRGALLRFQSIEEILGKAKTPLSGRLPTNAFTSAPNLDVYANAALTGSNPRASQGARSQAQYDFLQELSSSGAVSKDVLENDPEFKRSRAGVQRKNVLEAAAAFLKAGNPSVGPLTNSLGDYSGQSIERLLQFSANSGTGRSANASRLLKYVQESQRTAEDQGLNNSGVYSPTFGRSDSGLAPGQKISVTAGDALKAAQATVEKTLQSVNATVIRAALQVDGTIKVMSDVKSSTELQQLAADLTASIGKQFQAQITDLNVRLSKVDGAPPPTPVSGATKANPYGNNLTKGSDGFIRKAQ